VAGSKVTALIWSNGCSGAAIAAGAKQNNNSKDKSSAEHAILTLFFDSSFIISPFLDFYDDHYLLINFGFDQAIPHMNNLGAVLRRVGIMSDNNKGLFFFPIKSVNHFHDVSTGF